MMGETRAKGAAVPWGGYRRPSACSPVTAFPRARRNPGHSEIFCSPTGPVEKRLAGAKEVTENLEPTRGLEPLTC